jgi:serine/threonine-protein kinase
MYLAKLGDTSAALAELDPIATRSDLSAQMRYRMAVVHEIRGDRERALRALEGALDAGYPANELQREPEFLQLRNDARYHRLIDRFRSDTK